MEYDLVYPNMNFAHKTDCGPEFAETFEEHYHIVYEMLYLVEGDVELILENKKFTMAVGDLAFIQPGQHHHINPLSDKKYERYVIKFPEYEIPKDLLPVLKEEKYLLLNRTDGHPATLRAYGLALPELFRKQPQLPHGERAARNHHLFLQ